MRAGEGYKFNWFDVENAVEEYPESWSAQFGLGGGSDESS